MQHYEADWVFAPIESCQLHGKDNHELLIEIDIFPDSVRSFRKRGSSGTWEDEETNARKRQSLAIIEMDEEEDDIGDKEV